MTTAIRIMKLKGLLESTDEGITKAEAFAQIPGYQGRKRPDWMFADDLRQLRAFGAVIQQTRRQHRPSIYKITKEEPPK